MKNNEKTDIFVCVHSKSRLQGKHKESKKNREKNLQWNIFLIFVQAVNEMSHHFLSFPLSFSLVCQVKSIFIGRDNNSKRKNQIWGQLLRRMGFLSESHCSLIRIPPHMLSISKQLSRICSLSDQANCKKKNFNNSKHHKLNYQIIVFHHLHHHRKHFNSSSNNNRKSSRYQ